MLFTYFGSRYSIFLILLNLLDFEDARSKLFVQRLKGLSK